jgi:hypothetical protein
VFFNILRIMQFFKETLFVCGSVLNSVIQAIVSGMNKEGNPPED